MKIKLIVNIWLKTKHYTSIVPTQSMKTKSTCASLIRNTLSLHLCSYGWTWVVFRIIFKLVRLIIIYTCMYDLDILYVHVSVKFFSRCGMDFCIYSIHFWPQKLVALGVLGLIWPPIKVSEKHALLWVCMAIKNQ